MAILDVKGLTMRFGGLTAVSQVDFSVEKGQIFSIIGPNGAGKTTVFNAVTGLYEPTEGDVRFEGRDLRRPFRPGIAISAALIGLLTALALTLLTANVDTMWRSVVTLNYADPKAGFSMSDAWRSLKTYVRAGVVSELEPSKIADLEVKRSRGQYVVRVAATKGVLEICADEETANRRKEVLDAMVVLAGSLRSTESGNGRWYVATSTGEYQGLFDSEAAAQRHSRILKDLPRSEKIEIGDRYALAVDGRILKTFQYAHEPDEYKALMAYAADNRVEKADGRWVILEDAPPTKELLAVSAAVRALADNGRKILDVTESREAAKKRLIEIAVLSRKLTYKLKVRVSQEVLMMVYSPDEAAKKTAALEEILEMSGPAPVDARDGRFALLSADRTRVLAEFATREEADERAKLFATAGAARRRERFVLLLTFVLGLALGAGGTLVYWRRVRRTPDVISLQGLARTFQNIRLFQDMTVLENVLVAMDRTFRAGVPRQMLRDPGVSREEREAATKALEMLRFVGLENVAGFLAKNLPYGHQRRLEIARAMATGPRLLLLDEPAAGMNPTETVELMELIRKIRDRGLTVVLIEHHMKLVMGISDRIIVLDHGVKIAEGTPAEVRANPKVIEAYLGKEEH